MKQKLFGRNFLMVVIGQIISLFGNAVLRFALPLYLLNETGSSTLYGAVTACAFLPSIVLAPLGGLLADRVNKRDIMVVLDFATAAITLLVSVLLGRMNLIFLSAAAMMLLYGIAGAYQPSVQASIPVLVQRQQLMVANSVINMVQSLASLLGPVLGGILYGFCGLKPVLLCCAVCFFASAVMELFIHIPYEQQPVKEGLWKTAGRDLLESVRFLWRGNPVVGKGILGVCGINLFLSAMLNVCLPYMITEVLDLKTAPVNQLYGLAEGVLAAGGLAGGICAGVWSEKLQIRRAGISIVICAMSVFPIGLTLALCPSGLVNYGIMVACCFAVMFCASIFSIQILAFVQEETPSHLAGKVMAVILTVSMCAQPAGMALYGLLFDLCAGFEYAVVTASGAISLIIAAAVWRNFCGMSERVEKTEDAPA